MFITKKSRTVRVLRASRNPICQRNVVARRSLLDAAGNIEHDAVAKPADRRVAGSNEHDVCVRVR